MVKRTILAAAGAGLAALAVWSSGAPTQRIAAPAAQPAPQHTDWLHELAAAEAETPAATGADCDFTVAMDRVHAVTRDEDGRIIAAALEGDAGPAAAPRTAPTS